eukprot:6481644-Amphidinium_carterae.1
MPEVLNASDTQQHFAYFVVAEGFARSLWIFSYASRTFKSTTCLVLTGVPKFTSMFVTVVRMHFPQGIALTMSGSTWAWHIPNEGVASLAIEGPFCEPLGLHSGTLQSTAHAAKKVMRRCRHPEHNECII